MKNKKTNYNFFILINIGLLIFIISFIKILAAGGEETSKDFTFVQLSDTHWGFNNPKINPDYAGTLKKAIAQVNSLFPQPDFIVITGDLTQTTDDPKERKKRMIEVANIFKELKVKDIKFMPGEHDAGLDNGTLFKEVFGKTHYSFDHKFDHKGIHFIVLDNTSDATSSLGEEQLNWLKDDLNKLNKNQRIVVFTHRPLFDLYQKWDWWTRDGNKAIDLLMPYSNVIVFYGHIHQINHYLTGHITHYAAMGLMYSLPAPGSVPKKAPIEWSTNQPYKGLGFRTVQVKVKTGEYIITEYPLTGFVKKKAEKSRSMKEPEEKKIKITAKKFEFSPNEITLIKGELVTLEFTSLDRKHGFECSGLGIDVEINTNKSTIVHLVPQKVGTFEFHCDIYCGAGHEDMTGKIIVLNGK